LEAEYIRLSEASGEALWLWSLMHDIAGVKATASSPPTLLATDSLSAMAIIEN
jgi:hypothetical protein